MKALTFFVLFIFGLCLNARAEPQSRFKIADVTIVLGKFAPCLDIVVENVEGVESGFIDIKQTLKKDIKGCKQSPIAPIKVLILDSASNELDMTYLDTFLPSEVGLTKRHNFWIRLPKDLKLPITITLKEGP